MAISHSLSRRCAPTLPACARSCALTASICASSSSSAALLDLRDCVRSGAEHLLLPLELLQEVGLEIGARRDVGDLEQREQRRVMIGRRVLRGEVADAREQILEAHQRADALVQRMLVADHGDVDRLNRIAPFCGERVPVQAPSPAGAPRSPVEGVAAAPPAARCAASGPPLSMTSSARASRAGARQLRGHDRAHLGSASRPLRAMTRRTCSSSGQSTTSTRSTRASEPPRSSSSGTTSRP